MECRFQIGFLVKWDFRNRLAFKIEAGFLDPWGAGLVVNGMLLTTLLPIFLAVVAGFFGLFFAWTPNVRH